MRYVEHRPPPPLDLGVECIWLAESDATEPRAIERILPDGCLELIVHLGDPFFRWSSPRVRERQPRAFVIGQITRFLLLEPGGPVRTLGIRFRPGGAGPFLGLPVHELTDQAVPLADVMGVAGHRLQERLREARDERALVDVVFSFLAGLLARGSASDGRVRAVVREIVCAGGEERVATLADRVGWSPRQLERCFRSAVGLSPKAFSRIMRFQSALRGLSASPRPAWVAVALESGYFDQAHLIRDFRQLAGVSPGSLLTSGPLARNFTSAERLEALFDGSASRV